MSACRLVGFIWAFLPVMSRFSAVETGCVFRGAVLSSMVDLQAPSAVRGNCERPGERRDHPHVCPLAI